MSIIERMKQTLASQSWRRDVMREPLVHFLLAGLAVFILFGLRGNDVDPASRTITITEARVAQLAANWAQTWQRPPTPSELDGLIRDDIKEEIYYREAKRLGLDENDLVIRRRLRSKMEFLARSEAENAQPDDQELQALLDRNPAKYALDARYSFDQIYLSANDEDATKARAKVIAAELAKGVDWTQLGDSISLPRTVDDQSRSDVARTFGEDFPAALGSLERERWSGPIASGFGLHLVRIRRVDLPQKPKLADVRQKVENDWRAETIRNREAKAYQALLDGYTIRIDKP